MPRTTTVKLRGERAKRLLHWAGGMLALAGILFVVLRLRSHAAEIDFARFTAHDWSALAGLATVYAAANVLLALAWRDLLAFCGEATGPRWAIRTYGISQLGKYVPGNIFHMAGRQALGMSAGLAAWPLARSALWELGLISVAGGLFALLVGSFVFPAIPVGLAVVLFVLASVFALWAALRLVEWRVARALGQQMLFLVVSGSVFIGSLALVMPAPPQFGLWPAVCGAYVVAWLAGLVTPGAPAGMGVREVVLLFLLSDITRAPDLILAVLLGRIVSVLGDALFFAAVFLLKNGRPD